MLAFALFAAVVTITPGVDTMLVLRTAAVSGRRAGLSAMAGIVLGCLIWAVLSAVGVAAVLTASRPAFEVLRAAGVGYLLYLGIRALWASRRSPTPASPAGPAEASAPPAPTGPAEGRAPPAPTGPAEGRAPSYTASVNKVPFLPFRAGLGSFGAGLTTNLLNPKVGAFYVAVMPAFLPDRVPAVVGALALGAIHAAEGVVWLSGVALLVGRARRILATERVGRWLERLAGVVFIGFGVRLALERAPG